MLRDQFKVASLTHTTTSPNYQILASLDVTRRQVHSKDWAVQSAIEKAVCVRQIIHATRFSRGIFACSAFPTLSLRELSQVLQPGYPLVRRGAQGHTGSSAAGRQMKSCSTRRRNITPLGRGHRHRRRDLSRPLSHGAARRPGANKTFADLCTPDDRYRARRGVPCRSCSNGLRRLSEDRERERERATPPERALLERRRRALIDDVLPLPGFSGFAPAFRAAPGAREGNSPGRVLPRPGTRRARAPLSRRRR